MASFLVEVGLDFVKSFGRGSDFVDFFEKNVIFWGTKIHFFVAVGTGNIFAAENKADVFDNFFFCEIWMEGFVVVVGASEDFCDVAGTVGRGNNFSVEAARVAFEAGAVVFDGL